MRLKIVVDMNLSPQWAPLLRQGGYHAVLWPSVGDPCVRLRKWEALNCPIYPGGNTNSVPGVNGFRQCVFIFKINAAR